MSGRSQFQEKIDKENREKEERMKLIRRMEAEELQLIKRLQATQQRQQAAYEVLEDIISEPSEKRGDGECSVSVSAVSHSHRSEKRAESSVASSHGRPNSLSYEGSRTVNAPAVTTMGGSRKVIEQEVNLRMRKMGEAGPSLEAGQFIPQEEMENGDRPFEGPDFGPSIKEGTRRSDGSSKDGTRRSDNSFEKGPDITSANATEDRPKPSYASGVDLASKRGPPGVGTGTRRTKPGAITSKPQPQQPQRGAPAGGAVAGKGTGAPAAPTNTMTYTTADGKILSIEMGPAVSESTDPEEIELARLLNQH